ncbi:hypothetical protein PPBDW_II0059 [Photobacterium kishitanii]|nr:hypothetical protein PPBDW_II0059 [Photobacterium kishitanii]
MQITKTLDTTKAENSKAFTAEYSNQKSKVNVPSTPSYRELFLNHAKFVLQMVI